jgi:hypothetical protein
MYGVLHDFFLGNTIGFILTHSTESSVATVESRDRLLPHREALLDH